MCVNLTNRSSDFFPVNWIQKRKRSCMFMLDMRTGNNAGKLLLDFLPLDVSLVFLFSSVAVARTNRRNWARSVTSGPLIIHTLWSLVFIFAPFFSLHVSPYLSVSLWSILLCINLIVSCHISIHLLPFFVLSFFFCLNLSPPSISHVSSPLSVFLKLHLPLSTSCVSLFLYFFLSCFLFLWSDYVADYGCCFVSLAVVVWFWGNLDADVEHVKVCTNVTGSRATRRKYKLISWKSTVNK